MKTTINKIISLFIITTLVGCSKTETPSVDKHKNSDALIKRINDTKETCNLMKLELVKMKKKIDDDKPSLSVSDYDYRRQLPEIYLKKSAEFIKVCGVHE